MADYIKREDVLRCIGTVGRDGEYDLGYWPHNVAFQEEIKELPAADVRPVVRGGWEDVHIDRPEIADLEVATMFCQNCNRWHNEVYQYGDPIEFVNFCPNCGADMRGEDNGA